MHKTGSIGLYGVMQIMEDMVDQSLDFLHHFDQNRKQRSFDDLIRSYYFSL